MSTSLTVTLVYGNMTNIRHWSKRDICSGKLPNLSACFCLSTPGIYGNTEALLTAEFTCKLIVSKKKIKH